MRKYNIPLKDVKEVKQEIAECSSGSGEGVKEYYYKILTDDETLLAGLSGIVGQLGCTSALYKRYDNKLVKLNGYITDGACLSAYTFIPLAKAFAITGEEYDILQQHENYIQIHMPKGDIFTKLEYFAEDENTSEIIEFLKSIMQEITKEEYEAMITYKPE